jgi:hypothetical protein
VLLAARLAVRLWAKEGKCIIEPAARAPLPIVNCSIKCLRFIDACLKSKFGYGISSEVKTRSGALSDSFRLLLPSKLTSHVLAMIEELRVEYKGYHLTILQLQQDKFMINYIDNQLISGKRT